MSLIQEKLEAYIESKRGCEPNPVKSWVVVYLPFVYEV